MSLALLLLAAISAASPTQDEPQAMTRCFARASLEQPWRARSADELAADPAFAEHLSDRCNPEIVPLFPRAYDMADEQLQSNGGTPIDRISLARANIVRIITEMLPEAMRWRNAPPQMTAREQRLEFDRWLLDGEVSDRASIIGRVFEVSHCLGRRVGERSDTDADPCEVERLIADIEAAFAARFPEADPTLTSALVRSAIGMGATFAIIGEAGPAPPAPKQGNRD